MNLYELKYSYLKLQELIENDEATIEELADTIESIEDLIDIKAENYARIITQQNYNIQALESEIKRMQNRKDTLENKVKWLKDNLKEAMIATKKDKIKTDMFSISVCNNSQPSLEVADESLIPEKYYKTETITKLDSTLLKEDLNSGQAIYGVKLNRGKHIRIR